MISVIGGSGFIGTRLVSRLINKYSVTIVDKNVSSDFSDLSKVADIRSKAELISSVQGDVVVNLAAEHRDDVSPKSLYHEVNVVGAENICDVANEKGIRKIVFTSSVAVYGFAPIGTDESGGINPFNEYGKTKWEAEKVYRGWQQEDPVNRSLVVIRPTVVFGERNRGNVYNLLKQIASGKFMMIGSGRNRKSMAYVENVAAFIEYSIDNFGPGIHTLNYIDKPDFDMNSLVRLCRKTLVRKDDVGMRIPYLIGIGIGRCFDFLAVVSRKKLPISSIRVKKFCADSSYNTAVDQTDFKRPVAIEDAIERTLRYEFLEDNAEEPVFYTE